MERDSSEPEDVDTGPVTFDLVEVRWLTNLGCHTVDMAFQVFAGAADEYGIISCAAFNQCFRKLADPRSESDAEALSFLLTGLYDIFDSDKNARTRRRFYGTEQWPVGALRRRPGGQGGGCLQLNYTTTTGMA